MTIHKRLINQLINIESVSNCFKFFRKKYIILYYHGVVDDQDINKLDGPNKHLFISKSHFISQMSFLKKNNIDVISMDDLYSLDFKPTKFSVVLSFDDGYKDNLNVVYPILKEKNYPFIIYLVPKLLKEEPWVWWLELWSLLKEKDVIIFENKKKEINTLKSKIEIFIKIKAKMKCLKIEDQKKMISELFNTDKRKNMSNYFLNKPEIFSLIKDNIVSIGSHTHDHLSLKKFDKQTVFEQIKKSKEYLENTFNRPIKHFSYPYGQSEDIAFHEHKILSSLGFQTGVTTLDYSFKKFNQYYLNRCSIGPNVEEDDFKRKLLGVDRLLRKMFLK